MAALMLLEKCSNCKLGEESSTLNGAQRSDSEHLTISILKMLQESLGENQPLTLYLYCIPPRWTTWAGEIRSVDTRLIPFKYRE